MGKEEIVFLPPVAYSQVYPGIYRGSHPSPTSYPFLSNLNLKLLICVDGCDMKKELQDFCRENNILLYEKNVGHNQEPFVMMSEDVMNEITNLCLGYTPSPPF